MLCAVALSFNQRPVHRGVVAVLSPPCCRARDSVLLLPPLLLPERSAVKAFGRFELRALLAKTERSMVWLAADPALGVS